MSEQHSAFQSRVKRIHRSHARRVPYAFTVRPDGLLVPRTRSRLRFYFPWRALLAGFVAIALVKATMIAALGQDRYEDRMAALLAGSAYEAAATAVLQPDPVSTWTALRMRDALTQAGLI